MGRLDKMFVKTPVFSDFKSPVYKQFLHKKTSSSIIPTSHGTRLVVFVAADTTSIPVFSGFHIVNVTIFSIATFANPYIRVNSHRY